MSIFADLANSGYISKMQSSPEGVQTQKWVGAAGDMDQTKTEPGLEYSQ